MNMVIVLEILAGIVVLAAAVRFAVRDARQRRGVTEGPDTGEVLAGDGEREPAQVSSEAADQREGEEEAALSAQATVSAPPAEAR
ncbi:MAG: hypothetical protein M3228_09795 [Actinomycetota bacterium]|nr:hypothetical protein [Actinomycetota bacterium]